MTDVWPDLERDVWYARCGQCGHVCGPHDDAIAAEVDADTHCPGFPGNEPAIVNGGTPPGNLYAEVS